MGIRLSAGGGLTFTQKQSCGKDSKKEAALLAKLTAMSMNKPIIEDAKKLEAARKEGAATRRSAKVETQIQKARGKVKSSTR